jgi:hypothetical protein
MEEEIITIATLTIDSEKALGTVDQTKKKIFELQDANKALRKDISATGDATGEQTKKFVENEAEIKRLNAVYKEQSTALNSLTLAQLKETEALTKDSKSKQQAVSQNKELIIIRDRLNATTEEGAKGIQLINDKLDKNNAFIKDNSSALEKQKGNVGNYQGALDGLDSALAKFGINGQQARSVVQGFGAGISKGASDITSYAGSMSKATASAIGFGNATNKAKELQALQLVTTSGQAAANGALSASTAGVTVATGASTLGLKAFTIALASTGIGLIVVALGVLFAYLKDLDPLLDKIEQGFAAVGAMVRVLGEALANFSFDGLGESMGKAADEAAKLVEAQQNLADMQNSQEVANAKASQQYDELIVKSKNRTLTEKERLAFLQKAEKIEEQNYKQRSALAQAELNQAIKNAEIKGQLSNQEIDNLKKNTLAYGTYLLNTGKITQADLDRLKKAELGKIEIDAESTKRLEKNQNAQDKLQDDAAEKNKARAEKQKAAADKARQEEEANARNRIDILKLEAKANDVTAEQKMATAVKVFELENELAKKSLSGTEEQKKLLENRQNLSSELLSIAEQTVNDELEAQKKITEGKKKINEEEKTELLKNSEFLKQTQLNRVNSELISESEKAKAKEEIEKGYLENVTLINQNFEAAEKERKETSLREEETLKDVAFEMRMLRLEEEGLAESELKKLQLENDLNEKLEALDAELEAEKKTAEEVRVLKELEEAKYSKATKAIDKEVQNTKRTANVSLVKDSIAAATAIFGENKALAVAGALINTYQGISAGVKLGYPAAIPAVAMAAATGFAAVKNILSTNKGGGGSTSTPSSNLADTGQATAKANFENPARTDSVAQIEVPPIQQQSPNIVPVLVLENLNEANKLQEVKINSN